MSITFNNTVYATGFVGEDDGQPSTGFGLDNVSTTSITVNGTVTQVGDAVTVTGLLPGSGDTGNTATTNTLYVTQYDNSGMILLANYNPATGPVPAAPFRYVLSNTGLAARQRVTFASDPALTSGTGTNVYQVTCFASGTLIRTAQGDVAVEDLAIGDLVVTSTGTHRPIRWIGHRTTKDCRNHPDAPSLMPVRIAAHAMGPDKPSRDLYVSPGHAMCFDVVEEVLVLAGSLINGTTVQQVEVDEVTYWHVELDSHDILVSENVPAESYMDMGHRGFFREADVIDIKALPDGTDASRRTHADFCRPVHLDGPVVDAVRLHMGKRAKAAGWAFDDSDALAGLHLVVDGRRVEPELRDLSARFLLPAEAKAVWLVSETNVPAAVGASSDLRALGVCVGKIVIEDGFKPSTVEADDPRLGAGFHDVEQGPQRWTCGRARLPASLWEGCRGSFFLRVELTRPALGRWIAPGVAVHEERIALAG